MPLWEAFAIFLFSKQKTKYLVSDVGGKFYFGKGSKKINKFDYRIKKNVKDLNLDVIEFFGKNVFWGTKARKIKYPAIIKRLNCIIYLEAAIEIRNNHLNRCVFNFRRDLSYGKRGTRHKR